MWSLTMRTAELNADFTYYTFIMTQQEFLNVILLNFSEPVLYIFQWFIHSLLDNVYMTWIISDLVFLFIFYHAIFNLCEMFENKSKTMDIERFYPAIFIMLLISWPFFLGFNLTYRQFVATILFFYALGYIKKSSIKTTVIFIFSVATHNATFFFIPLIGFFSDKPLFRNLGYMSAAIMPMLLLSISNIEYPYVGLLLAALYPLVITSLCLIVLIISIGKKIYIRDEFTLTFLFLPYLSISTWVLLPNGAAERFGIMIISILLPIFLIFVLRKVKYKYSVLGIILVLSSLPIFIFYQSMLI